MRSLREDSDFGFCLLYYGFILGVGIRLHSPYEDLLSPTPKKEKIKNLNSEATSYFEGRQERELIPLLPLGILSHCSWVPLATIRGFQACSF